MRRLGLRYIQEVSLVMPVLDQWALDLQLLATGEYVRCEEPCCRKVIHKDDVYICDGIFCCDAELCFDCWNSHI